MTKAAEWKYETTGTTESVVRVISSTFSTESMDVGLRMLEQPRGIKIGQFF